jgi:nitroimidazol reductase NimA-like FMN-containing flavoprotein (pyridoxamine 5'-phosphate oxidase superfamily)
MSVYAHRVSTEPANLSGWPSPPDPGDLSKRLVARRTELRLSTTQVAARACISRRYLEYMERYPSTPGAAVLRRVAAALLTTPAALLGASSQAPPEQVSRPHSQQFLKLSTGECRTLIEPGGIGRIAFSTAAGPMVLPVNFTVVSGSIVIRTTAGSLIDSRGDERVAFEVDHLDEVLCHGWSVLIQGQSHRVLQPGELRHLREAVTVVPWAGGPRDSYVRIVPYQISGRRIEPH